MIKRIYGSVIIALTALTAMGQGLQQEVDVQRTIVPERREAVKRIFMPEVILPELTSPDLEYSRRTFRTQTTPTITMLAPVAYADSIYTTGWRGYAMGGFLPLFNLDLSAGYKILDSDRTRLSAHAQLNSRNYQGDFGSEDADRYVRDNTASLGLSLHSAVGAESFVDAGIDYSFARFNLPLYADKQWQSVNRLDLTGMFTTRFSAVDLVTSAAYGLFSYGESIPQQAGMPSLDALKENRFRIGALASTPVNDSSRAGLDVDFSLVSNSATAGYTDRGLISDGSLTHALLTLNPYYRSVIDRLSLDLGVRLDLSAHSGKAFHLAPDAKVNWQPARGVNIFALAGGGEWQNTAGSLYEVSRFSAPVMAYKNSHIPVTAEGGINVASAGFHGEARVGWYVANEWLMPIAGPATWYLPIDMKGYKLALSAGYDYNSLLSIDGSLQLAPQSLSGGYYLWRDRARWVAEIDLTVRPTDQLTATLAWNYRGSRQTTVAGLDDNGALSASMASIGNISDVSLSVDYRVARNINVWLTAGNLLNRRQLMVSGTPEQGINGLVGASYLF